MLSLQILNMRFPSHSPNRFHIHKIGPMKITMINDGGNEFLLFQIDQKKSTLFGLNYLLRIGLKQPELLLSFCTQLNTRNIERPKSAILKLLK